MSAATDLYACVYAREFPAQALLRLRPELHGQPCIVLEGEAPTESVCSLNTRSRLMGLRRGMTKVEVDTFSGVTALQRSVRMEISTSSILLECAGNFSPRIEDRSTDGNFVCALDIAGTESLFGPPEALGRQLRTSIRSAGITASVTVSANLNTAVCLARGLPRNVPLRIVRRGGEADALSNLPLHTLDINASHEAMFSRWGIRTIGELAALPEASLVSRLGQEGTRLLQLARGMRSHLFQPIDLPFVLEEERELDSPLDDLESLLFGLSTMLEQLISRATSRVYALASITITLRLDGGGSHTRTVNPRVPTNEKQLWLKLLHLDLEGHPPPAAILGVHLHAEQGATSKVQLGLFSPQLPESGRLAITMARIGAIVGEENVGRAVLDDTHRGNNFHVESFDVSVLGSSPPPTVARLCMRVLRPALRTTVIFERAGQPCEFEFRSRRYRLETVYGPWVSGGDWWNESIWGNEQWDVIGRAADSSFLACRLAHDLVQDSWHVAALYD